MAPSDVGAAWGLLKYCKADYTENECMRRHLPARERRPRDLSPKAEGSRRSGRGTVACNLFCLLIAALSLEKCPDSAGTENIQAQMSYNFIDFLYQNGKIVYNTDDVSRGTYIRKVSGKSGPGPLRARTVVNTD